MEEYGTETAEAGWNVVEGGTYDMPEVMIPAPDDRVEETLPNSEPAPQTVEETGETAQPPQEASEVAETETLGQTIRLESLAKDAKEGEVLNRPNEDAVIAAAQRGERQVVEVTRNATGKPVEFKIPPSLKPPGATATPVPAETAPAKGEQGEQGEQKEPVFKAWARILSIERLPEPGKPPTPTNELEGGMQIENLLSEHSGAFKVKIVADGVPANVQGEIMGDLADAIHDARQTRSRQHEADKLEAFRNRLQEAEQTGLVRRMVVVGVEDPADLNKVAHAVASSGFKSNEHTLWTAETDNRGQVIQYKDEASALRAGEEEGNNFISAEQLAREVRFPDIPVPGLDVRTKEDFAANRKIPEGQRAITVGDILDNEGNPAGPLGITEKDFKRHGLIAASSGAGKTFLIRHIVTEAAKAFHEKEQNSENPEEEHTAIVIVDFEKIGNYSQRLADQLAGANLPKERATVHVISPGSDGIRPNVNLLRLTGNNTPMQQISIAVKSLSLNIGYGSDGVAVFEKYATMAMKRAFKKVGWNLDTDGSNYPKENGPPPIPDMEQVATAVQEVLAETSFQGKTQGDLGGFTETTLRQTLEGIPGKLFQGGYDIDWKKVLASKGPVVIELGRIDDPEDRAVAMAGIFHGIMSVQKARNPNGDTDKLQVLLVMDETGGVFSGNTISGRKNAGEFTKIRGYGAAAIVAQQNPEELDKNVHDNTGNTWAMQMNSVASRTTAAQRMSIPVPEYLAHAPEGHGLYHGRDMPGGPVRFRTPAPDTIPMGKGTTTDALSLVDLGSDPVPYTGEVKVLARDMLVNTEDGNLLRGAIELNTALTVMGRDTAKITGDFKERLRNMTGQDAQVRDAAIAMAVKSAVDARPDIMYAMKRTELTDYLMKETYAQIRGDTPPQKEPFALQLKEGYYSAVKDHLNDALTARRLEDTVRYEEAFSRKISGITAREQLDNLTLREKASVKALGTIVSSGFPSETQIQEGVDEVKRLLGSEASDVAIHGLRTRLTVATGNPFTKGNAEELFDYIVDRYKAETPPDAIGYPDMRRALNKKIEEVKLQPALDLSQFEDKYGERFSGAKPGQRYHLAQEQLDGVEAKEKEFLAKAPHKVPISGILFAPDLIRGGIALDNIVASFVASAQERGPIYEAQRRLSLQAQGQAPTHSLISMLHRGDSNAGLWGQQIGSKLLMNNQLYLPVAVSRFLVKWAAGHIEKLTDQAKAQREQAQNVAATRRPE